MKINSPTRLQSFIMAPTFAVVTCAVALIGAQSAPPTPAAGSPTKLAPVTPAANAPTNPPSSNQPIAQPVQGALPTQTRPASRPAPAPIAQPATQQPANGQVGNDPRNFNESIPNSEFEQNQTAQKVKPNAVPGGNAVPAGVGYNNQGGIVNSDALQSDALNNVHYHYHYSNGGFSGNTQAGYAQAQYVNPDKLDQPVNPMMNPNYGPGNPAPMNVDAGNMYVNNPNSRVGSGAGVSTTWNSFLNNGAGMLTYGGGGGGGVEGFND